MKSVLIMGLVLISLVIISGCVQEDVTPSTGDQIQQQSSIIEAQAYSQLDQELESAVENIDLEDLEKALLE